MNYASQYEKEQKKKKKINWNVGDKGNVVRSMIDPPSEDKTSLDCIEDFTFPCGSEFDKHGSSGIFSKGLSTWVNKNLKRDCNFETLSRYVIEAIKGFTQKRHDFDAAVLYLSKKANVSKSTLAVSVRDAFKDVGLFPGCKDKENTCVIYVTTSSEKLDKTEIARKTICLKLMKENYSFGQAKAKCKNYDKSLLFRCRDDTNEFGKCLLDNHPGELFENETNISMWVDAEGECGNIKMCDEEKESSIKGKKLALVKKENEQWCFKWYNAREKKYALCRVRTCTSMQKRN